ncbi:hypothetical protein ACOME3_005451 [Neoechinorhynchus agilis]
MSAVTNLFSSLSPNGADVQIYDRNRNKINLIDQCKGKIVGLYFSASWCPPCRAFTPILANFYEKYHASKKLEIIFISSDKDPQSAYQYYMKMPFWRLSFQDNECRDRLKAKLGVQSIPRLVLLNADNGEVINKNAVPKIMNDDREGFQFPWKQRNRVECNRGGTSTNACQLSDGNHTSQMSKTTQRM